MDKLDHALALDASELDLTEDFLDSSEDLATPVSWRSAVVIWTTLSILGWAAIFGVVLAVL